MSSTSKSGFNLLSITNCLITKQVKLSLLVISIALLLFSALSSLAFNAFAKGGPAIGGSATGQGATGGAATGGNETIPEGSNSTSNSSSPLANPPF